MPRYLQFHQVVIHPYSLSSGHTSVHHPYTIRTASHACQVVIQQVVMHPYTICTPSVQPLMPLKWSYIRTPSHPIPFQTLSCLQNVTGFVALQAIGAGESL